MELAGRVHNLPGIINPPDYLHGQLAQLSQARRQLVGVLRVIMADLVLDDEALPAPPAVAHVLRHSGARSEAVDDLAAEIVAELK
ncbi:MAG: hypothetical protein AAGI06_11775 [Pseudomonadota bacterium]